MSDEWERVRESGALRCRATELYWNFQLEQPFILHIFYTFKRKYIWCIDLHAVAPSSHFALTDPEVYSSCEKEEENLRKPIC